MAMIKPHQSLFQPLIHYIYLLSFQDRVPYKYITQKDILVHEGL